MASKPSFGALRKPKPVAVDTTPPEVSYREVTPKPPKGFVVSTVRLDQATWMALKALAARRSVETGVQVTMVDLLRDGAAHVLALHGGGIAG